MTGSEAENYLKEIFSRVYAWARKRSRRVPKLTLQVGCADITRRRRAGDPRAFFHVGHLRGRVCTVPEAAKLHPCFLCGLMLHEIGHPMAQTAWRTSEQHDADRAVREFVGARLFYKGPLLLEWVSPSVVDQIMRHTNRQNPAPMPHGTLTATVQIEGVLHAFLYQPQEAEAMKKKIFRLLKTSGASVKWPDGKKQWIHKTPVTRPGPVERESMRYAWDKAGNRVKAEVFLYTQPRGGKVTRERIGYEYIPWE